MSDENYQTELVRAEKDETKAVDESGCVFWVESFDDEGVYYHSDDGETFRASHDQFSTWMRFEET